MPNPPKIEFYENANYVPHYQPANDLIRVPKMSRYPNLEDYYNTVFHELTTPPGTPSVWNASAWTPTPTTSTPTAGRS